ncbi:hypothetical protein J6590_100800 [Homalodisca vitripennis]|nr:hypothetical protein J6590_100800 [Homalodisca vitripennis]
MSQELDNSQVQNNVIAGQVLMPPENCPEILYNMMKRCWNYQPEMRPTFLELVEWILGLPNFTPNQNFPMVSYYHNRCFALSVTKTATNSLATKRLSQTLRGKERKF